MTSRVRERTTSSRIGRFFRWGLCLTVLVVGTGCGWQVWEVSRGVSDAQEQASALQAALADQNYRQAQREADEFLTTAREMDRDTSSVRWSVMTTLPWLGTDLDAMKTASQGLLEVAGGANRIVAVLGDERALLKRGEVSVPEVRRVLAATRDAISGLRELDRAAGVLSDSRLSPIRAKADRLQMEVDRALAVADAVGPVLSAAPTILGEGTTRNYLLVFQNNAEVRATGGLLGSAALLTLRDGRMTLRRAFSPVEMAFANETRYEFTSDERLLYGSDLRYGSIFLNSMPSFARVATLLRQQWGDWFTEPLDGVISLDTVSLSYLLDATGPIKVMGQELSSDNVVGTLLSDAYRRFRGNAEQDQFFAAVATTMFSATTSGVSPAPLVSALRRALSESRLSTHFFGPKMKAANADPFSRDDSESPSVAFGLNNISGDKMSYFLRTNVSVRSTGCSAAGQSLFGSAKLRSTAPRDAEGLPPRVTEAGPVADGMGGVFRRVPLGSQLVQVVIRGPVGGSVGAVEVDGRKVSPVRVRHNGDETVAFDVMIPAQESREVRWTMLTAPEQTGDGSVVVTPGVEAGDSSSRLESACA